METRSIFITRSFITQVPKMMSKLMDDEIGFCSRVILEETPRPLHRQSRPCAAARSVDLVQQHLRIGNGERPVCKKDRSELHLPERCLMKENRSPLKDINTIGFVRSGKIVQGSNDEVQLASVKISVADRWDPLVVGVLRAMQRYRGDGSFIITAAAHRSVLFPS